MSEIIDGYVADVMKGKINISTPISITANDVVKFAENMKNSKPRSEEAQEVYDALFHYFSQMILNSDFVKIVRCKDCKHNIINHGRYCTFGDCLGCLVADDFYCKNGERKETNE